MMDIRMFILGFLIMSFFSSCEEKLLDIPEFELVDSKRVVLIEELTGVSCTACPMGAATIEQIKENYGEQVVAVAIHGSFLSWPTSENKYDFRTPEGMELEDYLQPWDGKPAASVNRIKYTEELSISTPPLWSNYIDAELKKDHVMDIFMESTYDETSRTIELKVSLFPLKDFAKDDKLHLTVMVLESEIEDAQEDPIKIIEDFTHNHVLRAMLTETKGNPIQKDLAENVNEDFTFTFVVPEPENGDLLWRPEHMELVAFVNKVDGDTKDVLQAAEIKVIR